MTQPAGLRVSVVETPSEQVFVAGLSGERVQLFEALGLVAACDEEAVACVDDDEVVDAEREDGAARGGVDETAARVEHDDFAARRVRAFAAGPEFVDGGPGA